MSKKQNNKAVVLVSGGLDSSVCLWWAVQEYEKVHALFVDYGQRSAPQEKLHAERQSRLARAFFHTASSKYLSWWSDSRLFAGDLPVSKSLEGEEAQASAEAVWVPGRNGVLVSMAAAFAESIGAETVVLGSNKEEGATFRDNTPEFVEAADNFTRMATSTETGVVAPLLEMDKVAIVRLGRELGVSFEEIWSCYEAGEQMCGECESCLRLERALEEAGERNSHGEESEG